MKVYKNYSQFLPFYRAGSPIAQYMHVSHAKSYEDDNKNTSITKKP
jgi:hypothetical protein